MKVLSVAQSSPSTVRSTATVYEAVRTMQNARGGATLVVDDDALVGIVSERDVMLRVVAASKDAEATLVREVMTTPVESITEDLDTIRVLELMVSRHIRHLPVLDSDGRILGLVSMRDILLRHIDDLRIEPKNLEDHERTIRSDSTVDV